MKKKGFSPPNIPTRKPATAITAHASLRCSTRSVICGCWICRLQEEQPDALVFLGKVGIGILKEKLEQKCFSQYDLVFLLLDEEDEYYGHVETLPSSLYAMIRFRGSHQEAPVYYQKLINFLALHQWEAAGFSQEITLIDNGMTSDPEKFVTEIRIPVRTLARCPRKLAAGDI